ncbi:MAG: bifunctional adenosylcobinamide kinase/adenosylcobinamide-phosphate guanylyltransferase [Candidatus Rokuibacteriota bacterium]|nr:MAG: bifunctional adenosylcobinamide kinase/adenosylcobinamide-phosphate guanylyltransferase [Candidatus Rokubacteria bacterium]
MALVHRSELILGGVRSGKSRYALARARQSPGPTVFIATARALDAAMQARIAAHRAERPTSWLTVEEPLEIVSACRRFHARYQLVLVDCLTLWVSNRLLRSDSEEMILGEADGLAKLMRERLSSVVVVSNEVGEGVHPPTEVGFRFSEVMGQVNQRIAAAADRVTLMVAGIPLAIKDSSASGVSDERAPEAP